MKWFAILIACLFFQMGFSQNKFKCGWYGKMPPEKRLASFPFNKAQKILLLAFPSPNALFEVVDDTGEGEKGLVLQNDSLSYSRMHISVIKTFRLSDKYQYCATEIIELNPKGIEELSNLMFNYKLNKTIGKNDNVVIGVTGCYEPRNAVLFLDDEGKIISSIEICFECGGILQSPETIPNFNILDYCQECTEMKSLYNSFFIKHGIKYGTRAKK
jgi:hypothetical protein